MQAAGAAALGSLVPRAAAAHGIAPADVERLEKGEVVRVPLDLDLAQGDYFGGVAYAAIHAPVPDVMAALLDPAAYTHILPLTLEARVIEEVGLDRRVFFKQGSTIGSASYVLIVRRESLGLIRFWLDPSEPHEIGDCWGYFRVQPWGKQSSLLTYAALLHLDFGMVKLLFSETIRRYALGTPGLVRAYVQGRGAVAAEGHAG
jgi:hypothetical protein